MSCSLTPILRALGLAVAFVLAAPALAEASSVPPPGAAAAETVVLALQPAAPTALHALAFDHRAGAAARRSDLAGTLPAAGRAAAVQRWLAARGFTVRATGPLTITATAPAGTVAGELPGGHVPAGLATDVTSVVTSAQAHRWRPQALPGVLQPAAMAGAYARPVGALGAGAVVATVQFSGWPALANPATGDLASWASRAGIALPSITAIGVNGASPTASDGNGGDVEVALDQEALLAAAPAAAQRVYVTTNGDAVGGIAVWDRILSDVRNGVRITAVSTSWGDCEQDFSSSEVKAVEQDLQALSALGVSVFAASGDNGAYDCGSSLSVDYPAASPEVVGVGGTDLTTSTSGYRETAWGSSVLDNQPGDGSGGGVSARFARPTWQASVATSLAAKRIVPDIASEADPSDGMGVVDGGSWYQVGGTSLAAPTQAGLYAATLAAAGHPSGTPVEVHQALYGAGAAAFRDITSGTNDAYAATTGYDPVTGLGGPQWSSLTSALTGEPATTSGATPGTTSSGTASGTTTSGTTSGTTPGTTSGTTSGTASGTTSGTTSGTGTGTGTTSGSGGTTSTGTGTTSGTTSGTGTGTADGTGGTSGTGTTDGSGGTETGTGGVPTSAAPPATLDVAAPTAAAHLRRSGHHMRLRWSASDPAPSSGIDHYRVKLQSRRGGHVHTVWVREFRNAGSLRAWMRRHTSYRLVVVAVDNAGHRSARAVTAWHRR